jgi:hypothetical protein
MSVGCNYHRLPWAFWFFCGEQNGSSDLDVYIESDTISLFQMGSLLNDLENLLGINLLEVVKLMREDWKKTFYLTLHVPARHINSFSWVYLRIWRNRHCVLQTLQGFWKGVLCVYK